MRPVPYRSCSSGSCGRSRSWRARSCCSALRCSPSTRRAAPRRRAPPRIAGLDATRVADPVAAPGARARASALPRPRGRRRRRRRARRPVRPARQQRGQLVGAARRADAARPDRLRLRPVVPGPLRPGPGLTDAHRRGSASARRQDFAIGVEEELILVDARTHALSHTGVEVLAAHGRRRRRRLRAPRHLLGAGRARLAGARDAGEGVAALSGAAGPPARGGRHGRSARASIPTAPSATSSTSTSRATTAVVAQLRASSGARPPARCTCTSGCPTPRPPSAPSTGCASTCRCCRRWPPTRPSGTAATRAWRRRARSSSAATRARRSRAPSPPTTTTPSPCGRRRGRRPARLHLPVVGHPPAPAAWAPSRCARWTASRRCGRRPGSPRWCTASRAPRPRSAARPGSPREVLMEASFTAARDGLRARLPHGRRAAAAPEVARARARARPPARRASSARATPWRESSASCRGQRRGPPARRPRPRRDAGPAGPARGGGRGALRIDVDDVADSIQRKTETASGMGMRRQPWLAAKTGTSE